jgi:hypothetical protein
VELLDPYPGTFLMSTVQALTVHFPYKLFSSVSSSSYPFFWQWGPQSILYVPAYCWVLLSWWFDSATEVDIVKRTQKRTKATGVFTFWKWNFGSCLDQCCCHAYHNLLFCLEFEDGDVAYFSGITCRGPEVQFFKLQETVADKINDCGILSVNCWGSDGVPYHGWTYFKVWIDEARKMWLRVGDAGFYCAFWPGPSPKFSAQNSNCSMPVLSFSISSLI